MKTLLTLTLVLFAQVSFASTTEVYCQFWNSLTHTPEGRTLKANFQNNSLEASVTAEESINPKSFEAVGLTMRFTKSTLESQTPATFGAELWSRSVQGGEIVADKYVRYLNTQKIENFVLTATVDTSDGTHYISALCSPQN